MTPTRRALLAASLAPILCACGSYASLSPNQDAQGVASPAMAEMVPEEPMLEDEQEQAAMGGAAQARKSEESKEGRRSAPMAPPPPPGGPKDAANAEEGQEGEGRARSWFPDAFLWQPQFETGADGLATIDVALPHSLTTWRLLALAHDRRGLQAGAEHTFAATLPVYVDPVVPGWLMAGDRVWLPVQAVNTTDTALSGTIELLAEGAATGLGSAYVTLSGGGSDVRTLPLEVTTAGIARVQASLSAGEHSDKATREIVVGPTGRPVRTVRVGTLADARQFTIRAPTLADASTDQLDVAVFPGALSIVHLELERLTQGARPDNAAYGFALSAHADALSPPAGVAVDDNVLRKIEVLSWQRLVRPSGAPDAGLAADLLASLKLETEHPQVVALLPRLVRVVAQGQRADGTWSRNATSTLQQVLVETAFAARALPMDASGPRLRATGAIERQIREVKDAYTAAVLLASGLVPGSLHEPLNKLLEAAITEGDDGVRRVAVPAGVRNPWGRGPSQAEMLAWSVLALPKAHAARTDLAAALMQSWSASAGFGAGDADALALEALVSAMPNVTGPVEITLSIDGAVVATGQLDPKQPRVPAMLQALTGGTAGVFEVRSTPAVPGLAFVATRRSYVPWTDTDRLPGVEVQIESRDLRVGRTGTLTVRASAPSGARVRLEQPIPSNLAVDEGAVSELAGLGATMEVYTDRIVITTRAFQAGEVFEAAIAVTPAFAGRLQTGPLVVSVDGSQPIAHKPLVWTIGS